MEKADVLRQGSPDTGIKSARIIYPAVADSVDLPDFSFFKDKDEKSFVLLESGRKLTVYKEESTLAATVSALGDQRLKTLLAPLWPENAGYRITFNISGRRAAVLTIKQEGLNVIVDAHWNLFIPYFDQIKRLPIVHPQILDVFTDAVFYYAALSLKHPREAKNKLRNIVIDGYRTQPELLLASLDIFNKSNVYHIRPTRSWATRILAANDEARLEIKVLPAALQANPEFLEEVTSFLHKIVKNYAFRYADYLWTQKYIITFDLSSVTKVVSCDGKDIIINIHPLMDIADWKPVFYLSIGYDVMCNILQSSGGEDKKANIYLAMMKTWNRYLSLDESLEKENVCMLYGLPQSTEIDQCRSLSECMIGKENLECVDDFMMLMFYSSRETFVERLKLLNEYNYQEKTGAYFEQLWNSLRTLNTSLMKNNINYSKLIEVLRNDNIDHLQLAELLRTGRLGNRNVVDVSEWHLLKTLLYDLINAPKVFKNDYKMLLNVLTKVNKSLIVYIWTLGIDNDERYEMVSAYIAKLMINIFVFNRVKIYEIVADPVECLEAEAVTGYLLNWAGLTPEERYSNIKEMLSGLPRNLVEGLTVQKAEDVDQLIRVMSLRTSGIFGFYLHQAYRWGSKGDRVTESIRSYFPELLKQAQKVIIPTKRTMGGAMLLLLLAQIISDARDGFAGNIHITKEDKQTVRDLIKHCVDWNEKHFVIMVGGIAAGYMGDIDGWVLQQFDALLARYDGGDRVVLRSVVQFDVENLIERTLITTGEERTLLNKIKLLRFGVDPVVSDQANRFLRMLASRYGIPSSEIVLKKKNISELVLKLSGRMQLQLQNT